MIQGQRQRLEQVWMIIINNALDELLQREDVRENRLVIRYVKEQEWLVVRFEDNGRGIESSVLPHIFEPLVSTKEHGGMGLGLNIAQKIIQDHHGSIRAFNTEHGAVFEVALPAA